MKTKVMAREQAVALGFSPDNRKRRRQHRIAARRLLGSGGVFNSYSAAGSSFWALSRWHLEQARAL